MDSQLFYDKINEEKKKGKDFDVYLLSEWYEVMLRYQYKDGKSQYWVKFQGFDPKPVEWYGDLYDYILDGELSTKEIWEKYSSSVEMSHDWLYKTLKDSQKEMQYVYNPREDFAYRFIDGENGEPMKVWVKGNGGKEYESRYDSESFCDALLLGYPLTKEEYDNFSRTFSQCKTSHD